MKFILKSLLILLGILVLGSCEAKKPSVNNGKPRVIVSYSILHSLIKEWVGGEASVELLMPNGADPHEWAPSARDIESLSEAQLVIANGLGLEAHLETVLNEMAAKGVKVLKLSDYFEARKVAAGEELGGGDPHVWTDPTILASIITKLRPKLEKILSTDLNGQSDALIAKLGKVDKSIEAKFATIPQARRIVITGHDSLSYFASRYQIRLLGAVIPGLSSQAEVSASELGALKSLATANKVKAIFTELGTPKKVAISLAEELGVKTVEIDTHLLPEGGDYFDYLTALANTIASEL